MRSWMLLPIALFTLAVAAPAFALSVDHETGMNEDGTAKFSDPDDQMPNLLNTPLTAPSSGQAQSGPGLQGSTGSGFNFSARSFSPQQQQQDAFDHAYAHFGN